MRLLCNSSRIDIEFQVLLPAILQVYAIPEAATILLG